MALSGLSHHNVLNALAGARPPSGWASTATPSSRAAHVPARRRPQPRPDEHLLGARGGRRGHGHRGPRPQRGRPRGPARRVARPHRARRAGAPQRWARRATAPTTSSRPWARSPGARRPRGAAHKAHYLRGRTTTDLEAHLRIGLARAGVADVASYPTELAGLQACLEVAEDGDVVALMCHAERAEVVAWLRAHGAVADDPDAVRRKVVRARGEHEAEDEIAALWEVEDAEERCRGSARSPTTRVTPGSPTSMPAPTTAPGTRRRPCRSTSRPWRLGLREPHRHRAQLQLASSLRNLGRLDEAGRRRGRRRSPSGERRRRGVPRPRRRTTPVSPRRPCATCSPTLVSTSTRPRRRAVPASADGLRHRARPLTTPGRPGSGRCGRVEVPRGGVARPRRCPRPRPWRVGVGSRSGSPEAAAGVRARPGPAWSSPPARP